MSVDPTEIRFYAKQEQSKVRGYWMKLASAIIIPLLLGYFVWPYFYYAITVTVSTFFMLNRLPPSTTIKITKAQKPTEIPDIPGTRALAQVACPHCGQISDVGNVYCPFCQRLMKKMY